MPVTRCVILFVIAALGLHAGSEAKREVEMSTTETIPFVFGGAIQLGDSFGEVEIEGWDRPDVEITIHKVTHKKYSAREQQEAIEHLERVKIRAEQPAPDRLVISTTFPPRNLFTRPLKGKTNLQLTYKLKVPYATDVVVKHDVGAVQVANICGNIDVTNRIGEVSIRLAEDEEFHLDAKSRIGDVNSQFGPPANRKLLVGAEARRHSAGKAHQVYLRVGIGEISVRKIPQPAYPVI